MIWLRDALLKLTALPLLALPLALLLGLSPAYRQLSEALDDSLLRLSASAEHYTEVLAVDIDDASLQALQPRFGEWPYQRDVYALLLNYLRDAGVKVVVFDIVFAGAREGDAAFAKALAQRPDVVLAAAGLRQPLELDQPSRSLLPRLSLPASANAPAVDWPDITLPYAALINTEPATGAVGMISTSPGDDGRLRELPLLHRVRGYLLPSLPLAALLRTQTAPDWQAAARRWPLDAQGRVRLHLPSNADAVPMLDWAELMNAALGAQDDAALRHQLKGRALFIGSSAFFADAVMTPQGQMSGTKLLASAYAAMSRDALLGSASRPWQAALWLLAWLPSLWVWRRQQPQLAQQLAPALISLGLILLAGLGLLDQHRMLPLLGPLTVLVLGLVLTGVAQLRWEHLTNRRLRYERAVADAANQAKSEFLANVSHEIRTPMNALLGMAELLGKSELNAEQRRYVEVFHSAGQSLFELINDLLDVSKIEAGRLELQPRAFELEQLFTQHLSLLRPRAEAQGLSLTLSVDASAQGWALGDPQRLAQVLVNLVGNAIKFTRQGGISVSLRREPPGGALHLEVKDTGIGIAPSKHGLIFKPFTQADGSVSRLFGGTGLGLSISRSLVEMMGGRIWLESLPGHGSTFHVALPLPPVDAPAEALAPANAPSLAELPTAPLSILLCEDNEINVLMMEAMLQPQGHRIDVAENGDLGLHKFRGGRYDLVLMDVQMPGMDGLTATRELRRIEAEEQRERTPVIALTANAFEADRQRSLSAGCDDHLTKPITQTALLQALARHARAPARPGAAPAAIVASDLSAVRCPPVDTKLSEDPAQALASADALQRQRSRAHASVFLGAWRQAWASVEGHQARAMAIDLGDIASQIGAQQMASAAAALLRALDSADAQATQRAARDVDTALTPLLVELTSSG